MARFDLSDAEWSVIAPLLPNKPRGVPRVDDRRVLDGIFYILRTGAPWRDLPEDFGNWFTVYTRFWRWAQKGAWEHIFKALCDDPDFEYVLIDGTLVRVHQHGTGAKGGLKIRP